jgi:TonB family protein
MLDQLERHVELEEQQQVEQPRLIVGRAPVSASASAFPAENDQRQRRRMVVALILLLVALGLVLVKDRDFWFPATPDTADADAAAADDQPAEAATQDATPVSPAVSPSVRAAARHSRDRVPTPPVSKEPVTVAASNPAPSHAVLPPLRVEVVAGDNHQPLRAGSPSVRVDMQPGNLIPSAAASPTEAVANGGSVTRAGERVQMSAEARQQLEGRAVRPEYPLLARQMKVQGEVPLMATISTDGHVQGLQVLGGPAILADAAQDAVKQWRFKNQPVETQIPISVVFTISTK